MITLRSRGCATSFALVLACMLGACAAGYPVDPGGDPHEAALAEEGTGIAGSDGVPVILDAGTPIDAGAMTADDSAVVADAGGKEAGDGAAVADTGTPGDTDSGEGGADAGTTTPPPPPAPPPAGCLPTQCPNSCGFLQAPCCTLQVTCGCGLVGLLCS